ncbi:MAG: hypothetical protein IPO18_07455 [bacterium]|nr:hypothetical protein [bacterium]
MAFAGKYRLIDIPISNCINSGMKKIFVLTQFLSASMHRHIMAADVCVRRSPPRRLRRHPRGRADARPFGLVPGQPGCGARHAAPHHVLQDVAGVHPGR